MFGRHPRLAIDAFLGIRSSEERKPHQDYSDKLKDRLADAYQNASKVARLKSKKNKRFYDQGVCHSGLESGVRALVKKVGINGKHKLVDVWESSPYMIKASRSLIYLFTLYRRRTRTTDQEHYIATSFCPSMPFPVQKWKCSQHEGEYYSLQLLPSSLSHILIAHMTTAHQVTALIVK